MKTIALVWWWTWWHIYPLISVYNSCENIEDLSFIWFWERNSLEESIAKENDIEFVSIKSWKLRRYFDFKNFIEPLKNILWFFQSVFYLFHFNVDVVFSKWGYVSIPVCIAAKLLRKKIYIHESDIVWGASNKIVWRFADKIFYSFDNEKIDNEKHILSWQIVNPELLKWINREISTKENEKLEVVVVWWSQGSTIIFESILKIIKTLNWVNLTIILWSKNLHFREKFEEYSFVTIYDYIDQKELWKIYKQTDIAITRWWATTLWELYFFGIHSIIIPLKSAAQNHQELNAKYFENEVWSNILDEDKNLDLELFRLLTKFQKLRKSWLNLWWFNYASERIKKELIKKDKN